MKKYKSKYNSNSSSVTISKASMPVQSALKTSLTNQQANIPTCPTCGSTNVRPISTLNRAVSIGVFGLFSSKIGKNYECLNCKMKW